MEITPEIHRHEYNLPIRVDTTDKSRINKDKTTNSLVITQRGNGEEDGVGRVLGLN